MKVFSVLFIMTAMLLSATLHAQAQRRLVVLRYNDVVARFAPGETFAFKYKGDREKITTIITGFSDTEIYTYADTVSVFEVGTIYFRQHALHHTIGKALLIAGAGGFLIDQFNNLVFYGNKPSLDGEVNRASLTAVIAGLPLTQIKKKSQKMDYKFRPLIVSEDSHLYYKEFARKD